MRFRETDGTSPQGYGKYRRYRAASDYGDTTPPFLAGSRP